MRSAKVFILIFLLLPACSSRNSQHKPVPSGEPQSPTANAPGYEQVRPVFQQNCAMCHPSRSTPNWLDFSQAQLFARNGVLERKVSLERSMPPPGSAQAASMSEHDRSLLVTWARAGGPMEAVSNPGGGGLAELPKPLPLEQQCFQCHGVGGMGNPAQVGMPRIAGQNETYLATQIENFKWRSRLDPSNGMNDVASNLTSAQISEMANFFAKAQPPPVPLGFENLPLEKKNLYVRGEDLAAGNCVACHMNAQFDFQSNVPEVPRLANQSEVYLRNQLIYFRNKERINPLMNQIAKGLTDDDISALSLYFSQNE